MIVLISGSHGLGFASKFALMTIFLANCTVGMSSCRHGPELDQWFICAMGGIVLGSATTHTAELYLRRSYAEKVQSLTREAARGRRLEERNEQLQAEKERLLYDVQRRGRPLDNDDDRSAIRRGLLAGPSQPCPPTSDPSEPGGAPSSDSPPTLPPGPPSSASSGSAGVVPQLGPACSSRSDVVPLSRVEADRQWHAANPGGARNVPVVADNAAGVATAAESICGEELMAKVLAEMGTGGDATTAASTVHESAPHCD